MVGDLISNCFLGLCRVVQSGEILGDCDEVLPGWLGRAVAMELIPGAKERVCLLGVLFVQCSLDGCGGLFCSEFAAPLRLVLMARVSRRASAWLWAFERRRGQRRSISSSVGAVIQWGHLLASLGGGGTVWAFSTWNRWPVWGVSGPGGSD